MGVRSAPTELSAVRNPLLCHCAQSNQKGTDEQRSANRFAKNTMNDQRLTSALLSWAPMITPNLYLPPPNCDKPSYMTILKVNLDRLFSSLDGLSMYWEEEKSWI